MILQIEKLVQTVAHSLQAKNLRVATAESCTGGGLSYWLTSIAGSSAWFDRGFVTYSNAAKIALLDVPEETIQTFGAVSEETARAMAEGGLQKSQTDICMATTGIAGPGGGTVDKPVGTVWMAIAIKGQPTVSLLEVFAGDRATVREKTILYLLEKLADILQKKR